MTPPLCSEQLNHPNITRNCTMKVEDLASYSDNLVIKVMY